MTFLAKEWRLALSKGSINKACCLVLLRLIGAKFGTRKMLHNLGVSLSELLNKFHSMHIKSLCVNTHTEKAAYRCGCWTRTQKFALIRTVRLGVWTLILHSVTARKTGQAPTDSHVKCLELQR